MASGKVLEETYRKWVQYKEDCFKMIENEPLLQGMEQFHCYMAKGWKGQEREENVNFYL